MQTTFVGSTKFIQRGGRLFQLCDEAAEAATSAEWADKILSAPAITFPNGRSSHEVAGEVLDKAEDALIDFLCVTA